MKEYAGILDEYSADGYHMYSNTIASAEWGNKESAEPYLSKYWLPSAQYERKWRPLQDRIFINQDSGLPKQMFAPAFELLINLGGCLFIEEEFTRLRACILAMGVKSLVIIENTFGGRLKEPCFRMKYPADISWDELNGGNFVSAIMLEMPHKDYFVFGDSESWGRYSANDYEMPFDIIGYKTEHRALFQEYFKSFEADRRKIAEHLPLAYRGNENEERHSGRS